MSTIKVDRIEPQDGLQSNAMGGIVQVVRVVHTGQVSASTSTYVSTGLQASITPRSASNKIMVSFEHSVYHNGSNAMNVYAIHGIKILRGTQDIYTPISNSDGPYEFGGYDKDQSNFNNNYGRPRVEYLDSPATTSPITYSTKIACYDSQGIVFVNFNNILTTVAPQSWMTLTEITA
jgi:hypothetical protein